MSDVEKNLNSESEGGFEDGGKSDEKAALAFLEKYARELVYDYERQTFDFVKEFEGRDGVTDKEIENLKSIAKKYSEEAKKAFKVMTAIPKTKKNMPEGTEAKKKWHELLEKNESLYKNIKKVDGVLDLKNSENKEEDEELDNEESNVEREAKEESIKKSNEEMEKEIGKPGTKYVHEDEKGKEIYSIIGYAERDGVLYVRFKAVGIISLSTGETKTPDGTIFRAKAEDVLLMKNKNQIKVFGFGESDNKEEKENSLLKTGNEELKTEETEKVGMIGDENDMGVKEAEIGEDAGKMNEVEGEMEKELEAEKAIENSEQKTEASEQKTEDSRQFENNIEVESGEKEMEKDVKEMSDDEKGMAGDEQKMEGEVDDMKEDEGGMGKEEEVLEGDEKDANSGDEKEKIDSKKEEDKEPVVDKRKEREMAERDKEIKKLEEKLEFWKSFKISGSIWKDYNEIIKMRDSSNLEPANSETDPEFLLGSLKGIKNEYARSFNNWVSADRTDEELKDAYNWLLYVNIPRCASICLDKVINYYTETSEEKKEQSEDEQQAEEEADDGGDDSEKDKKPSEEKIIIGKEEANKIYESNKKFYDDSISADKISEEMQNLSEEDYKYLNDKSAKYRANYIKIRERSQFLNKDGSEDLAYKKHIDEFIRCSEMAEAEKLLGDDAEKMLDLLVKNEFSNMPKGLLKTIKEEAKIFAEKQEDEEKARYAELQAGEKKDVKLIFSGKYRNLDYTLENIEEEQYKEFLDKIVSRFFSNRDAVLKVINYYTKTNKILKEIAAKTNIPVEDDLDEDGKLINRGLRSIINTQNKAFYNEARAKELSENRGRKMVMAVGKRLGYVGLGVAASFTGVGAAVGAAFLGAGLGGARVADRVITSKWEEKKIKDRMAELKKNANKEELKTSLLAQIATLKQAQIDGLDEMNYKLDEKLDIAEGVYLKSKGKKGKEEYDKIMDGKQEIIEKDLMEYFTNIGLEQEQAKVQARTINILFRAGASDDLEMKLSEKKNNTKIKRLGKKMGFAIKIWHGGNTTREKAISASVYAGMGVIARELPIVRSALGGAAGMKGGDALANWRLGKAKGHEILRMVRHGELKDSSKNVDAVNIARLQLRDDDFKTENPVEYALLKQEMDKLEEESAKKAKDIMGYLKEREDKIKQTGDKRAEILEKNMNKRAVYMAIGGFLGAFGGYFAKDILSAESWKKTSGSWRESFDLLKNPIGKLGINIGAGNAGGGGGAENALDGNGEKAAGTDVNELLNRIDKVQPENTAGTGEMPAGAEEPISSNGEISASQETGSSSESLTESQLENAVVKPRDGIQHILIRQLIRSAKDFGFKGNPDDTLAVNNWAQGEAHRLAIKAGYVDPGNHRQILINSSGINNAAYKLVIDPRGDLWVREYLRNEDGSFDLMETRDLSGKNLPFETERESYESEGPFNTVREEAVSRSFSGNQAGQDMMGKSFEEPDTQPFVDKQPSEEHLKLIQENQRQLELAELEKKELISNIARREMDDRVTKIYKHLGGGNQHYEWYEMKNRSAYEIMNGNYGDPINRGIPDNGIPIGRVPVDGAERNNRIELRDYLLEARKGLGKDPEINEKVEDYLMAHEEKRATPGFPASYSKSPTAEEFFNQPNRNTPSEEALIDDKTTMASRPEAAVNIPVAESLNLAGANDFVAVKSEEIAKAIRENNTEYFTGSELGEIVNDKEKMAEGIIVIKYPEGHSLDVVEINFREKNIMINNMEVYHNWRWNKEVNSMEKIKEFTFRKLKEFTDEKLVSKLMAGKV
jgi:hypothetical protein